ncbi:MAG: riboflavin synthase [Firmicutes bacterium]|nr:riboflavin synthase [Bacillota bacterium]
MFTGIVEEVGRLRSLRRSSGGAELDISCRRVGEDLRPGESVAVNGVCLTVVRAGGDGFVAQVMPETLRRTNLGGLAPGDPVNLERALPLGGRLGGHLVTGHVDATGTVISLRPEGEAIIMEVAAPAELAPYLAPRGSVAVDGVSLTIVDSVGGHFRTSLIPHTLAVTNLARRRPGDVVNLEVDVVARYVKHLLDAGTAPAPGEGGARTREARAGVRPGGQGTTPERGLTLERLREAGFL